MYKVFFPVLICFAYSANLYNISINTGALLSWPALGKTYNGSISLLIKDKNHRETQLELYESIPIKILSDFKRTVDLDIDSRDIRNVSFTWKCSDQRERGAVINVWLITFDPIYRHVETRGAYFKFFCNYSWTKIESEELHDFYPCWIHDIHKKIDYDTDHNPN